MHLVGGDVHQAVALLDDVDVVEVLVDIEASGFHGAEDVGGLGSADVGAEQAFDHSLGGRIGGERTGHKLVGRQRRGRIVIVGIQPPAEKHVGVPRHKHHVLDALVHEELQQLASLCLIVVERLVGVVIACVEHQVGFGRPPLGCVAVGQSNRQHVVTGAHQLPGGAAARELFLQPGLLWCAKCGAVGFHDHATLGGLVVGGLHSRVAVGTNVDDRQVGEVAPRKRPVGLIDPVGW